jgi:ATP-dependent phosphoenolpyruvate carboxykinase
MLLHVQWLPCTVTLSPSAAPLLLLQVRVVTERAYHALFMHNMLIRPSLEELEDFGEPDFIIYNAGGGCIASQHVMLCHVMLKFVT